MKYAILIATLILAGCQARLDPAPQKIVEWSDFNNGF